MARYNTKAKSKQVQNRITYVCLCLLIVIGTMMCLEVSLKIDSVKIVFYGTAILCSGSVYIYNLFVSKSKLICNPFKNKKKAIIDDRILISLVVIVVLLMYFSDNHVFSYMLIEIINIINVIRIIIY